MTGRQRGLAITIAAYVAALAAAVAAGWAVRGLHPLWVVAVADAVGTVVVFGFSVACNNSSLYDPYWSVAPIAIGAYYWLISGAALAPRPLAALALVTVWGVRLTYNWASGWRGLSQEDWRYVRIRGQTGGAYWLVSLLGIHLMPTLMVYLGCLPLLAAVAPGRALGWLDAVALVVTAGAIGIEAAADRQLRRFVRSRPGPEAVLESGLWACSRHPNYFGELGFWWGLYLFGLAAAPASWWTGAGALAITLLFLSISLPLIERRMRERRPAYGESCRRRSLLIPWFPSR